MNNLKKYNYFVFIGTFSRNLIEVFIPIVLYNKGVSITSLFFFLLLNYSFSFLLNFPIASISRKITFKWLIVISSISIVISYYFIFLRPINYFNLIIIALTHVISAHIYWLCRHYFALEILPEEKMGKEVGYIVIFSQLAIIPASYIGALLINNVKFELILIIIIILYIISIIPLFKMKESKRVKLEMRDGLKDIYNSMPKRSIFFYIMAQFRFISKYLFPLYIYLFVKSNYEFIGIFNIAVGVASMFFVYLFARKMDKEKKDYLALSGVLSFIVWVLKINALSIFFMLAIGFMEGLVEKMYETAFNRNLYALGKKYNSISYAAFMEGLQSFWRIIFMLFFLLVINDITIILYICAIMIVITGFIGFDDGAGGY